MDRLFLHELGALRSVLVSEWMVVFIDGVFANTKVVILFPLLLSH